MKYLLDTNTCIFFLRGKLKLDEIIKEKGLENCFISEITVAELRFGAENSENPTKSHKAVDTFISGISIIPIFGSIKRYAKEKVRLRKLGTPINDEFDLLIGVTAVENKLTLVTDNSKHFASIAGIKFENWFKRK
jgi:tRNA(fMet)-specific endonuclease VapC